ncbi:MAG: heat-shock protein Hsp20 [Alphaproteobacteria bacterium]|nr:heat-shock protein Hsp20 [Alphaproteobacteria bacterium]
MTTRLSIFSSPLLLGFDQFERTLERCTKGSDSYPPYNIEQTGEQSLRITLAVAGFAMDDLSVHTEDSQLVIRGRTREEDRAEPRIYLHRGIAARQFQRIFVLAEGIEVGAASLDNGLLNIDLRRPVVEPKVQTIPITKGKVAGNNSIHINSQDNT